MYDHAIALACAQASARAYVDGSDGLLADIQRGNARVVIVAMGLDVIVACRGTRADSLVDWATDFDVCLVLFRTVIGAKCLVHQGFRDDMLQVIDAVRAWLTEHHQCGMVYYTGHSLGAAMALLMATSMIHVGGLYTFGQPKAGDADFAKASDAQLDGLYFRFVHHLDIVPRVPPLLPHAGKLALFDAAGHLTWPRDQGPTSLNLDEDVREHAIADYVDCLSGQ